MTAEKLDCSTQLIPEPAFGHDPEPLLPKLELDGIPHECLQY